MTATTAPPKGRAVPVGVRRFGYGVAIAVNGVMLWLAHQLLTWEWPSFLTEEFDQVLGLVTLSFVVTMVVNAGYLVRDHRRIKALGELITSAVGIVVSVRMWQVFPFDFTGWDTDWTPIARIALAAGILGTAIGVITNLVKLVTPDE